MRIGEWKSQSKSLIRNPHSSFRNYMKLLREILFPLIAVLAAFIVGGIIVLLIGGNPIETYKLLIGSALSWPDGIGFTLFYATPLIFTGLAVAVAFRCGLLNIGAEGQLYIAAFVTAWVGITFAMNGDLLGEPTLKPVIVRTDILTVAHFVVDLHRLRLLL